MHMTLTTANILTIAALTIAAAGLAITMAKGVMAFGAMGEQLKETITALEKFSVQLGALSVLYPKVEQHEKDIVSLQASIRNGLAKETRENTRDIAVIKTICAERHGHEIHEAFKRLADNG